MAEAHASGSDAFKELERLGKPGKPVLNLEVERQQLLADAAAGLVVAGRDAPWLQNRPKLLPVGQAVKRRGFATYDR